jgi:hypothetical protein
VKVEKSAGQVSVTAEKSETKSKGELESVLISKAGNGFVVETYYRAKPTKRNSTEGWIEPEKEVFTDAAAMAAYVTGQFGAKAGK